jgi:hypothetical protein
VAAAVGAPAAGWVEAAGCGCARLLLKSEFDCALAGTVAALRLSAIATHRFHML